MRSIWLIVSGVSGATAVAMGAYAAHGLMDTLVSLGFSEQVAASRIAERCAPAVQYHLVHSVALGLVAALAHSNSSRVLTLAGWAFLTGILLFSGLLYVMTFADVPRLGAIVPLGGLAYICGWIALAASGLIVGRKR